MARSGRDGLYRLRRTPLTLNRGPVRHLCDRARERLSPEDVEQVEIVERNADRLRRLVGQLLGLARLDAGTYRLSARPVDVTREAERFVDEFGPLAERKGLTRSLDVEPPPEDADPVYADREALGHVLSNLLSNVIKFTPEGGRVTVRVRPRREAVEIAVEDTGVGIPEAEQDAVFDRFVQTVDPSTREQEGAGIGLAFAADLVDLHGGTLTVESTEGEGTTFTASLPRGTAHLSDDQLPNEPAPEPDAPYAEPSTPTPQRSIPNDQPSTPLTEEPSPTDSTAAPDDQSKIHSPKSYWSSTTTPTCADTCGRS